MAVGGQSHALAALPTGKTCTEGWVDPRAVLDRCGKSLLHQDSIPGQSNP
jgi:hypothetical protein